MQAYILVETAIGVAHVVAKRLEELSKNGYAGKILKVSPVTGPYDVIVLTECQNFDELGDTITGAVQQVPGVQRTTTCLAMKI